MRTIEHSGTIAASVSPARAWLRALELTSPISHTPDRILPLIIEEMAARMSFWQLDWVKGTPLTGVVGDNEPSR